MALLGKFDENYTRTGNNAFTRMANWLSMLPNFPAIPFIGVIPRSLGLVFGFIGTVVESASWLLRGKVLSAATAFTTGNVSNAVNFAWGLADDSTLGGLRWWLNIGSGTATGVTMGTHARALTENVIGSVTGALGIRPTVLQSHQVGIGYLNGSYMPQVMGMPVLQGPGRFATMEAQRRGQDPQAYYTSRMSNPEMRDHVAALESARAQQPNQQGISG